MNIPLNCRSQIGRLPLLALLCAIFLAGCVAQASRQPDTLPAEEPAAALAQPAARGNPASEEILFLRGGNLVALEIATGDERTLADAVSDFAAAPGGSTLALIRSDGDAAELWLVGRDGGNLRRLTTNDLAKADPRWSPDGLNLAYTASRLPAPHTPDWLSWSAWCLAAEARVISVAGGLEQSLGAGCEPVFSPDGQRLALTTPPSAEAPGMDTLSEDNTIIVMSRAGTDRTIVASSHDDGHLVYSPAWSPDGQRIAYQRFLGYQLLVDVNLTEETAASRPQPAPIGSGLGWQLPPVYGPGGERLLVVAYNFSDERGFGGYEEWGAAVTRLGEPGEILLPSGPIAAQAVTEDFLSRATGATWAPDGKSLAVVLPPGWHAGALEDEPVFTTSGPGELWLWRTEAQPERRLAVGVDFASPVLWITAR